MSAGLVVDQPPRRVLLDFSSFLRKLEFRRLISTSRSANRTFTHSSTVRPTQPLISLLWRQPAAWESKDKVTTLRRGGGAMGREGLCQKQPRRRQRSAPGAAQEARNSPGYRRRQRSGPGAAQEETRSTPGAAQEQPRSTPGAAQKHPRSSPEATQKQS